MNKKNLLALSLLLSTVAVNVVAQDAPPATVAQNDPAATGATGPANLTAGSTPNTPPAPVTTPQDGKTETSTGVSAYFSNAWKAANANRVMTAALVSTSFLVGYAVHAAFANNDVVVDEDAE